MSHWSRYETQDIFCNEDNGVNNLLPFQDGDEVLESVTFSDHHKLQQVPSNDVKTSIYHEGSATEAALSKKDASIVPIVLKEGSSNILHPSLSFISEKTQPASGITKCSAGISILDCQGDKISIESIREGENDTRNKALCSDYGKRGDVHNKKLGDISSVDTFVGIPTKEQMSRDDDQLFCDYSSIGQFEDFERTFRNHGSIFAQGSTVTEEEMSWFSSSSHGFRGVKDTLQSVVLSSVSGSSSFNSASCTAGLSINILPGTKPSASSTELPSSTECSPLPLYPDAERKHKSSVSDLAYDHDDIVEKSLTLEQTTYGNDSRNPNMINATLKDPYTTKGKNINPTSGSTVQSSLSGCDLIQDFHDRELLSSFLPATQTCSPHVISMKTPFSDCLASNCLHSYNSQTQLSEILKSTIIKSSDLPDYITSSNLPSHVHHSMGMLPGPFSIPSMPKEKSKKMYACQQFHAASVIDNPLEQHIRAPEQHAEASYSSPHRKYKFEDVVEGDKGLNIGSSNLQDKSCKSSTLIDDISIKAASFQHLQMIIDRLGVRTKLCIRDSLYRLARSAEKSHCYGSANNFSRASSPVRGFQDSKRALEFSGVSTNEIERAVAYLLFHKSLGSGTGTADDSIWLRTPIQDPAGKCKDAYQSPP